MIKILHKEHTFVYVNFCFSNMIKVLLKFISVSFCSIISYMYVFGLITTCRFCLDAASIPYISDYMWYKYEA